MSIETAEGGRAASGARPAPSPVNGPTHRPVSSDRSSRLRLLDLYCGQGGASTGYVQAGFEVVGVDIVEQERYPYELVTADAMDVLNDLDYLRGFDVVHASPPCQGYTTMSNRYRGRGGKTDEWTRSIGHVRERLLRSGVPWVIENVVGARRAMHAPLVLRGGHFGLGVDRPRLFESSLPLSSPGRAKVVEQPIGVYGERPDGRRLRTRVDGTEQRAASSIDEASAAMGGLDWMSWRGLTESIPPSYTRWIGEELAWSLRAFGRWAG